MPVYEPRGVEYDIVSGHVTVVLASGARMPAFWSHPNIGGTFPSIALIHDWWGIRPVERRLAQSLAQMGYYVIVPDLFDGETAETAQDAMVLVEKLGEDGVALGSKRMRARRAPWCEGCTPVSSVTCEVSV